VGPFRAGVVFLLREGIGFLGVGCVVFGLGDFGEDAFVEVGEREEDGVLHIAREFELVDGVEGAEEFDDIGGKDFFDEVPTDGAAGSGVAPANPVSDNAFRVAGLEGGVALIDMDDGVDTADGVVVFVGIGDDANFRAFFGFLGHSVVCWIRVSRGSGSSHRCAAFHGLYCNS
jgi:hypothetical protein